jgi:outer membrane receptor protein involved in Fe transport
MRTAPISGFEFTVAYGYTHATFISYEVNSTTNYNGNFLPYVPRNTISLQASKTIAVRNSGLIDNIRINALYRGNGEIFWNEENSADQAFYGLLDAKVSFMRRAVQFDIWAKNILNADYASFYFEALGNKYVQTGKPAQIGINLSLKF